MKKIVALSLLMASPALFCMEKEGVMGTEQKKTRMNATVEAHRDAALKMLAKIQSEDFWNDEALCTVSLNGQTIVGLPATPTQWANLISDVSAIDYQLILQKIQTKVLSELGTIDPEVYEPIYNFTSSMGTYMSDFMKSKNDNDITALLDKIRSEKSRTIKSFNQCAPVIIKIGEACINVAFKQFVKQLPDEVKQYLPAAGTAAYLALGSASAEDSVQKTVSSVVLNLDAMVQILGKGYLSKLVVALQTFGGDMFSVDPSIRRAVYFVEQCAKIFFIEKDGGQLRLTYSPTVEEKFPLNDDYFKNIAFKDLCRSAFNGEKEVIERFAQSYTSLLRTVDENEQNLLGFAISGFCGGNDNAWEVFTYLLNQDFKVTKKTETLLTTPSTDADPAKKADRDERKQKVEDFIAVRLTAYEKGADFFDATEQPRPQIGQQSKNCIIS